MNYGKAPITIYGWTYMRTERKVPTMYRALPLSQMLKGEYLV